MEALLAVFAFGTLWFWMSLVVLFLIITACVETDSGVWATAWFIGGVVGLNYLCHLTLFSTILAHPGAALMWAGIYLLIGIGWSIAKWFFFLRKRLNAYNERKADFLSSRNATRLTPELARELLEKLKYSDIDAEVPIARRHKKDITRWTTYWPFSMLGTILNDFVRKIYAHIFEFLQGTYQKMSNAIFADANKDFELAKQFSKEANEPVR